MAVPKKVPMVRAAQNFIQAKHLLLLSVPKHTELNHEKKNYGKLEQEDKLLN